MPSSIFPAVQNLLLAATALGLGSALTTITIGYRDELRDLLGLPDHVVPVAVVPIGHPARALGPPRRDPFADAHPPRAVRRALGGLSTGVRPAPISRSTCAQSPKHGITGAVTCAVARARDRQFRRVRGRVRERETLKSDFRDRCK